MNTERVEKNLLRSIYKDSYYEFFRDAFAQLHKGSPYDDNWHIKYLCDRLQQEFWRVKNREPRKQDIIINVPFRSAKSMIATVIFPVWCWSVDPSFKFISVSYSADLALEHGQLSKDLINSPWFQWLYGKKVRIRKDANSKEFYKTEDDGFRKSVGTGGQITGSGADIIIVDDPQNPKKASSETERMNTIHFYDHTLFSRLNQPDTGVRIIVMQRLHEEDLSGHLLDENKGRPEDHQHICIPGELDESLINPKELADHYVDGLFWHTRFNINTLNSYKKALGDLQYAGQIQQSPAPPEGSIIKRAWFDIVKPSELTRSATEPIYFVMDTAYTEKQTQDPSGILAYFVRNNTMYIVNVAEVYKEFPDLIEWIKMYVQVNDYQPSSIIWIEPKASGKSIVQQLRQTTNLNVSEIDLDMLRDDKLTRASAIAATLQSGRVKLIEGSWNEAFLAQITMFPNAKHDEFVDCLSYAVGISLMSSGSMLGGYI